MAYIGNTVQNQGFAPAVDYFNGDGTTVTFTLSRPVASVAQLTAVIDNVIQNPSSAFTVSGSAITFTSAPLAGTNNIWVEYTSLVTTYNAISQDPSVIGDLTASGGYLSTGDFGNSYIDGTIVDYVTGRTRITTGPIDDMTFYHGGSFARSPMMDLYYAGGAKIYGTTALTIPVGTTGERPGTPAAGMHRMNTTTGFAEYWTGSQWASYGSISTSSISYLIVAGGGGGGSNPTSGYNGDGGGGAGGYLTGTASVSSGVTYTVTVGAGGAPGNPSAAATTGGNSSFTPVGTTALGGGGGGNFEGGTPSYAQGANGGSGGGSKQNASGLVAGGSGTAGQGNNGGTSSGGIGAGGGGGGAGAAGQSGTVPAADGGYGGAGLANSISGSSVYYAGGGGGGSYSGGGVGGVGGVGGGGNGASTAGTPAVAGTANRGGGGGGGSQNAASFTGAAGGSGVVIIAYPSTYKDATATGTYAKTVSGGNTIYTFTGSGTITF